MIKFLNEFKRNHTKKWDKYEKLQDWLFKSNHLINHIKCNWSIHFSKKIIRLDQKKKKASLNYFLSKETHTKYKTLIRDKFFKLVNGEIYYVHRLEDSKIIKISIPTKLTCKYNPVPIKISTGFYTNWQSNFKMHMEIQRTKKRQNNFEKNKVKGFILPDFRSYLKAIVIKRTWYSYKDKQIY